MKSIDATVSAFCKTRLALQVENASLRHQLITLQKYLYGLLNPYSQRFRRDYSRHAIHFGRGKLSSESVVGPVCLSLMALAVLEKGTASP
jgi:hypothetical protein